jgi:hypothetical protein
MRIAAPFVQPQYRSNFIFNNRRINPRDMDQFPRKKLVLLGDRNPCKSLTVPVGIWYIFYQYESPSGNYFANGAEPSSTDHPFVLQRSVAAGREGLAVVLRHAEGQEAVWEGANMAMRTLCVGPVGAIYLRFKTTEVVALKDRRDRLR